MADTEVGELKARIGQIQAKNEAKVKELTAQSAQQLKAAQAARYTLYT